MKLLKICLLTILLTSSGLFGQDKKLTKQITSLYQQNKYDQCITQCNNGIEKYKTDQLSEFYLFRALSYYYLASNNKNNVNYNSNIKRSVSSLKKAVKKDKVGSYYRIYNKEFFLCKKNLLKEAIEIEQNKQPALANYVEKNVLHTFKNKEEVTNDIITVGHSNNDNKEKNKKVKESTKVVQTSNETTDLIKYAKSKIGIPYKYGGTTDKGFDCSGFTWNVYHKTGINLPRTAAAQSNLGKKVNPQKAQVGDLVFFADKSKITHVGLITEYKNGKLYMIHASSSKGIRIDCIDDVTYWKSRFKYVKRI